MDPILGMICLFAYPVGSHFERDMRGWASCDGRLLQISQNQALFALLGNTYGGDGRTTFGLPKLTSPDPHMTYKIAVEGLFPDTN
jgi:microcystin-dependent protein